MPANKLIAAQNLSLPLVVQQLCLERDIYSVVKLIVTDLVDTFHLDGAIYL